MCISLSTKWRMKDFVDKKIMHSFLDESFFVSFILYRTIKLDMIGTERFTERGVQIVKIIFTEQTNKKCV